MARRRRFVDDTAPISLYRALRSQHAPQPALLLGARRRPFELGALLAAAALLGLHAAARLPPAARDCCATTRWRRTLGVGRRRALVERHHRLGQLGHRRCCANCFCAAVRVSSSHALASGLSVGTSACSAGAREQRRRAACVRRRRRRSAAADRHGVRRLARRRARRRRRVRSPRPRPPRRPRPAPQPRAPPARARIRPADGAARRRPRPAARVGLGLHPLGSSLPAGRLDAQPGRRVRAVALRKENDEALAKRRVLDAAQQRRALRDGQERRKLDGSAGHFQCRGSRIQIRANARIATDGPRWHMLAAAHRPRRVARRRAAARAAPRRPRARARGAPRKAARRGVRNYSCCSHGVTNQLFGQVAPPFARSRLPTSKERTVLDAARARTRRCRTTRSRWRPTAWRACVSAAAAVLTRLVGAAPRCTSSAPNSATSDLPELRHLRSERGLYEEEAAIEGGGAPSCGGSAAPTTSAHGASCRTRRSTSARAAWGGLEASCGEENLLAPDDEPKYTGRDILTHELAHTLMDYGLRPSCAPRSRRATARPSRSAGCG